MLSQTSLDVVLGANGPVGIQLVELLVRRGRKVRAVSRSGRLETGCQPTFVESAATDDVDKEAMMRVEIVAADAADKEAMRKVFSGAERVFVAMGVDYTKQLR